MSDSFVNSAAKTPHVTVSYRLSDVYLAMARRWRRWFIGFLVVAAFSILLPLGLDVLDGCSFACAWSSIDWGFSGVLFALLAVALVLAPFMGFLAATRRGDLAPITFTLTDVGLEVANRNAQSVLFWTAIKRVRAVAGGFVVEPSRSRDIMIPRRAFDSDEQFNAFAAAAQERWEQSHRL